MSPIGGFDHVAITVANLEATCAFYDLLFGARTVLEYAVEGRALVRQIAIGMAVLSVHQEGNGIDLVARRPTPGSVDLCLTWTAPIADALALLAAHAIPIVEGPSPRHTASGAPSQSVYFRDPDGNLIELMAADTGKPGD